MVVAQLVEQLLPIPEVRVSNPVISKIYIYIEHFLLSTVYWKNEDKEKEAGYGHLKKEIAHQAWRKKSI